MANFIIVVDPDPDRRSRFIQIITPLLPPVEGLITNSCTIGNCHAIWAAHKSAPISWIADENGVSVIWGEAIVQGESTRLDAISLREFWQNLNPNSPIFDGFYAAFTYHPHLGLTVGADLVGVFPIYYYTHGEVALVASSSELFKYHPVFPQKFNPAGLVGILLTNGLLNGQTLWQDVIRLSGGYLLTWQAESSPREISQYSIPAYNPEPYANLSFSEQLDILEQTLEQTLIRHVPNQQQYSLMLSGGLDSRMLTGFLVRRGIHPITLTQGVRSDIEMQCAVSVARTLNLEHHTQDLPFEDYPAYAQKIIKWEHLANGFHWFMDWLSYTNLRNLAPRVITGQSIDRLIGGSWDYSSPDQNISFDLLYNRVINAWGFSPQLLERLLRKEIFGDLVQDTLTSLKTLYNNYSDTEIGRTWWFDLYHRQRFNSGCVAWQLSFGAWPVQPFLDWQLLTTTASMPIETVSKRNAQIKLLCTRFPQLAQLPLDRNDYNVEPLQPNFARRRLAYLFKIQRKWRKWQHKQGLEQRYYYRVQDINNSGWQTIRQQAEPQRELIKHLFNEDIFNQLVPPPNLPMHFQKDSITEASSIKTLLGLLLWSKDHL